MAFASGTKVSTSQVTRAAATLLLHSLYIALYFSVYDVYFSPLYGYLGFTSYSTSSAELFTALICLYAPLMFLPVRIRRFSHFFIWFFFIIVYTPLQITVARVGTLPHGSEGLSLLLLASLFLIRLISASTQFSLPRLRELGFLSSAKFIVFLSITALSLTIIQFHSIMRLVALEDVYSQRSASTDLSVSRLSGYLLNWLVFVFSPILLALSFKHKKLSFALLASFLCLAVYMVNGSKIALIALFMPFVLHRLLAWGLLRRPFLFILFPMIFLLPPILLVVVFETEFDGILKIAVSQFSMRALGIQAVAFTQYVQFFEENPHTYFSHVTGINLFVNYPFQGPLGRVVGYWASGNELFSANSNFWASDGIAAAGYIGLPLIGVLVGLLLSFLDALVKSADVRFVIISSAPFLLTAANTPIFTAMVTGGGLLIFVFCQYLGKPSHRTPFAP
ncbi:hypothetical protein [Sulfitobacter sp. 1A15106]|uniref:hypothetical protein n=1 Tax=Sulfitobacter sp. 1A15106 TaxID=3368590 RepID=UPI0037455EF0